MQTGQQIYYFGYFRDRFRFVWKNVIEVEYR
jgi:hypothetical protein